MTENEWLVCADPVAMLDSMREKVSARKARLFACACCRNFLSITTDEQFGRAIDTAEQFADGLTSKAAMKRARQSVREIRHRLPPNKPELHSWWVALWLAEVTNSENAFDQVASEIRRLVSQGLLTDEQSPSGATLLRCVAGNPFRLAGTEPSFRVPDVDALAHSIYHKPTPEGLQKLAKSLEDAGCQDSDILDHCRHPGPHVRGCWVLDLLLGRK
jgi:hypothetical protein